MAERNAYIVTKALNSSLKGSVIIAISGHLVTTTDAVVVGLFIGRHAFTAINIIIPVLTLFSAFMIMMSVGSSVSISKALGNRESNIVNLSFSSSLMAALSVGLMAGVLTYKFTPDIIGFLIHGRDDISQYATKYLQTIAFAIPFLITAGVVSHIVRTDGNTRLVRIAVWIGVVINVILDVVFVGFLNWGISGAAWATTINYSIVLLVCLTHFVSRDNTIRWSNDFEDYLKQIWINCRLGFSTSLTNILMAVSLFIINSIMLRYEGNEGIYCWAVCYQVFLILQMLLSGVDASIFALGGMLLGEDDVKGLDYLYRRSAIYLIITIIILCILIDVFPEFFGKLFGNRGDDKLDLLPSVLKIFSIFLFPYGLVMQVRAVYTILGRNILSLSLCVSSFALMILLVYIASLKELAYLWWSFPVSSWSICVFLSVYTLIVHLRNKNLRMYSLIPKTVPGPMFNVSVALDAEEVKKIETDITAFLIKNNIAESKTSKIVVTTAKIMDNILEDLVPEKKKHRFFDVNVRIKGTKIIVILKDDGKRINRILKTKILAGMFPYSNQNQADSNSMGKQSAEASPIIEKEASTITDNNSSQPLSPLTTNYFYMNDQNTFTLNFN